LDQPVLSYRGPGFPPEERSHTPAAVDSFVVTILPALAVPLKPAWVPPSSSKSRRKERLKQF